MTPEVLLGQLRAQGVQLWISNGQLSWSAPGSCVHEAHEQIHRNLDALTALVKKEPLRREPAKQGSAKQEKASTPGAAGMREESDAPIPDEAFMC